MSEQTGAPPLGLDRTALMLFLGPYCATPEAARDAANALMASAWLKDRDARQRLLGAGRIAEDRALMHRVASTANVMQEVALRVVRALAEEAQHTPRPEPQPEPMPSEQEDK